MNVGDIEINRGELWIEKYGLDLVRVEMVIRGIGRRNIHFSHDDSGRMYRTSMSAFSRRYQYHATPPSKKYKSKVRGTPREVFYSRTSTDKLEQAMNFGSHATLDEREMSNGAV